MAINFRKLKAQIHHFKDEAGKGYIFIATDEQKKNFVDSVAHEGSKKQLIRCMVYFCQIDEDYAREFVI